MGALLQAIVVADLHAGCRFGLFPRGQKITLDSGGYWTGSRLQRKVWNYWLEFWEEWVPRVTRGEPYFLVINGDPLEGDHHRAKTPITTNHADQRKIARACLDVPLNVKHKPALIYCVRGTEAHSGLSAENEEMLAKDIGAVQDQDEHYTRYELRLRIGEALCDFQHHISTVNSNAYEGTALNKEFTIACEEAGRWGQEVPDIICRAHRHRQFEVRPPTHKHFAIAFCVAGWQLKTPLTHRMPGARQALPQFGGSLIRQGDEEFFTRHYVKTIKRSRIEVPMWTT